MSRVSTSNRLIQSKGQMLYKLQDKTSVIGKYVYVWLKVTSYCVECSVCKALGKIGPMTNHGLKLEVWE